MVNRPKLRVSGGIEPDGFNSSRRSLSAREAFHLNANPLELIEAYKAGEWARVLCEIERHQRELEAQRTPAQAEWAEGARRRDYVSTGVGADLITQFFRERPTHNR
jgi:hypothetical protein